jgi:hypothetical protein
MHWPKPIKARRLRARLRKLVRAWRKMLRTRAVPEPSNDPLELDFQCVQGSSGVIAATETPPGVSTGVARAKNPRRRT